MPTGIHTAVAGPHLLEIGEREFRLFREVIQGETGIQIKDAKRSLVAGRLGKRLRALGLETFREYYEFLQGSGGKEELRELVNCITTNKTSFFREEAHFPILREWLAGRAARRRSQPIRIWCGAASTGEEPYTIAMTALSALSGAPGFRLLASDIDTEVLRVAQTGIYPEEGLATVPLAYKKRYFLRGVGKWAGYAQVRPELRAPIEFRQFNLIRTPWSLTQRFDAIFLRNVVIYFDRDTQRALFERLAAQLEPEGLLFVGSSESLFWLPELFAPVGHAVYRAQTGVRRSA